MKSNRRKFQELDRKIKRHEQIKREAPGKVSEIENLKKTAKSYDAIWEVQDKIVAYRALEEEYKKLGRDIKKLKMELGV